MNENETLISEDMLDRLIELAVAKPSAPMKLRGSKPLLREDEYLVHVDYTIPSFAELEKEFGKYNVSYLFDGCPFQKHASCVDIDETPGERVMLVKRFGQRIGSEDVIIKEMDKSDYRPATYLELYAFQKANPDLQRQFWIVALGSEVRVSGGRRVASLWDGVGGPHLGLHWSGGGFVVGDRFLFVRK